MKKIPFKLEKIKLKSERVRFSYKQHIFNIELEYLPFRTLHNETQQGDLEKEDGQFYLNFYDEKGSPIMSGKAICHNTDLSLEYKRILGIDLDDFKIYCLARGYEAEQAGKVTYRSITTENSIVVIR